MKQIIKNMIQTTLGRIRRTHLENKNFSIISDNCWGGFVYQNYDIKYNTPFVGLFIFSPDYIKLLENLQEYLEKEIIFINPEDSKYKNFLLTNNTFGKYPIGLLGKSIEIHFLHYKDESEARQKWNKRVRRINFNNLIVKFSDRDLCDYELLSMFDKLPYENKLCFTAKSYPELNSVVHLKEFSNKKMVENEWKFYKKYINITNYLNNINR